MYRDGDEAPFEGVDTQAHDGGGLGECPRECAEEKRDAATLTPKPRDALDVTRDAS